MIFFGKKTIPRGAPDARPRIGVGRLFNPEIGTSLRPFGEAGKMLVDLIAMIFASQGLVPKDYATLPGLNGTRLTLANVIGTAWRNLSFTRENLPRVLIFFAVVMSLVCSVLAIFAALLAAFTGTAHAQTLPTGASMFQPVDTGNDIACGWINWLFNTNTNGCQLADYLSQATNGQQSIQNLESTSVRNALIKVLGFYSDAILVVAAIVLFYHLTSMVVETAHHGVAMGKRANQVWAPIRLVVAIGLLVPISSGLNSGQYIVVQIAQWGSGLASEAWSYFAQELAQDSSSLPQTNAPYVRQVVTDVVLMEACTYAYNNIMQSEAVANGGSALVANQIPDPPTASTTAQSDGSQKYSYQPANPNSATQDLCGSYVLPGTPKTSSNATSIESQMASTAQGAASGAFNQMQSDAKTYAQLGMKNYLPQIDNGNSGGTPTQNTTFEQIVGNYQGNLQNAVNSATSSLSDALKQIAITSGQQGWVSAGAWFNTIARVVGSIATIIHDLLPQTVPPKVTTTVWENNKTFTKNTVAYQVMVDMKKFQQWMLNEQSVNGAAAVTFSGGGNGIASEQQQLQLAAADMMQKGPTQTHMMDYIFWLVDWIASWNGVWHAAGTFANATNPQNFTLGVQFLSANPLAEIANLGHANIDAAYDVFDAYLLLQTGAGAGAALQAILSAAGRTGGVGMVFGLFGSLAGLAGGVASSIGAVLGIITVVFFTAEFMLAYFFPLIPFIRFLFGMLGWFLSLLEAVIAMPLVALAHLTPEGEGLPGDKAKTAYYFLFNLFLKPVLMVFGLIVGLLIFNLAASAMNLLYMTAIVGTGGISHGHVTLARIAYSIVYVVILYMFANNAFKMIDFLPEHCIKWMGAQGLTHPQMHDPTEIGQYMTAAAGYVDQKIVQSTGELMKTGGPLALGAMAKYDKNLTNTIANSTGKLGSFFGQSAQSQVTGAAQAYIGASEKMTDWAQAGGKEALGLGVSAGLQGAALWNYMSAAYSSSQGNGQKPDPNSFKPKSE